MLGKNSPSLEGWILSKKEDGVVLNSIQIPDFLSAVTLLVPILKRYKCALPQDKSLNFPSSNPVY
jgi:hypothetical protein